MAQGRRPFQMAAARSSRHRVPRFRIRCLPRFDRGLTKDYAVGFWRKRPYRALEGLTLEVEQGEVFGFLGPNGAGKTTTLKLLMQLIFPTSGRAEILGRPVGDVSSRQRIGYLPENPYFYDYLTAEELLIVLRAAVRLSARAARARSRAARPGGHRRGTAHAAALNSRRA